jgi:hypothetical protein
LGQIFTWSGSATLTQNRTLKFIHLNNREEVLFVRTGVGGDAAVQPADSTMPRLFESIRITEGRTGSCPLKLKIFKLAFRNLRRVLKKGKFLWDSARFSRFAFKIAAMRYFQPVTKLLYEKLFFKTVTP